MYSPPINTFKPDKSSDGVISQTPTSLLCHTHTHTPLSGDVPLLQLYRHSTDRDHTDHLIAKNSLQRVETKLTTAERSKTAYMAVSQLVSGGLGDNKYVCALRGLIKVINMDRGESG